MVKIMRRLIERAGFPLYAATSSWPEDAGFTDACRRARLRKIRGIPNDRCFTLYRAGQAAQKIPGNIIEMGSRAGKSSRFLLAGAGIESDKTLLAFDSFEGMSAPGQEDRTKSGSAFWKAGDLAVTENEFLENMQMYEHMVRAYKGWIPERFNEVKDETFSIIHIDVDLYQPTLDSLLFAYERLNPGGMIICDDYGSKSCPGARKAMDEFFADKPEPLLELPTSQAIVTKL
jgi:O-methyltransferase